MFFCRVVSTLTCFSDNPFFPAQGKILSAQLNLLEGKTEASRQLIPGYSELLLIKNPAE
jgi:hypothetical protein